MSKPRVSLRIDTSLSATRPSLPRTPSQPKHKSPKTPRRPGTPRTPTTPKTSKELIDDIVSMYESGIIPTTPNFDYVSIPVGSASPKDITRAYSTSKSWGKVVGAVIIAQAAARRWLAIRTVDRMRKEFSLAATKIASVWRGYIEFMAYRQLVKVTIMCQLATRSNANRNAAVTIASKWRCHLFVCAFKKLKRGT
eukprot:scaffold8727_cov62-Cyclotella_meneghiniana.AAC.1